jgi:hypothetical protein
VGNLSHKFRNTAAVEGLKSPREWREAAAISY